jgi:hypothetical protein
MNAKTTIGFQAISTVVVLLAIGLPAYGRSYLIASMAALLQGETVTAPAGYQEYTFKEYGFSIEAPIRLSANPPYKSSLVLMYEYDGEIPGKAGFNVCFYHLPSEIHDKLAKEKSIDDLRDSFLGDFKRKSENTVDVEGAYARDLFYTIPDPDVPAEGHARFILFKNTVCILSVIMPDSEYSSDAYQRFFKSFKILNK